MIQTPMDVLEQFPVRKTKQQKQDFRESICAYAEKLGYPVTVESGSFGCRNLIFGDPEQATYLVTAHYDTPAGLLFPNFATPCNGVLYLFREVCLWLVIIAAGIVAGIVAALAAGKWMIPVVACPMVFGITALMLFGPANKTNVNDNSSGVITVLEIMKTLPEKSRSKVCFVLFDLEEAGLIGSGQYRKMHRKATDHQLVLNLDCVGDGDHIRMFPTKKLKQNRVKCTSLYKACGYFGKKNVLVHEKGFYLYPSDQMHFPYGVGICALNRRKKLLYLSRIHTSKDTVLDITNVNILRAALTTFICRDAVQ